MIIEIRKEKKWGKRKQNKMNTYKQAKFVIKIKRKKYRKKIIFSHWYSFVLYKVNYLASL